jgi:hypothetical protein
VIRRYVVRFVHHSLSRRPHLTRKPRGQSSPVSQPTPSITSASCIPAISVPSSSRESHPCYPAIPSARPHACTHATESGIRYPCRRAGEPLNQESGIREGSSDGELDKEDSVHLSPVWLMHTIWDGCDAPSTNKSRSSNSQVWYSSTLICVILCFLEFMNVYLDGWTLLCALRWIFGIYPLAMPASPHTAIPALPTQIRWREPPCPASASTLLSRGYVGLDDAAVQLNPRLLHELCSLGPPWVFPELPPPLQHRNMPFRPMMFGSSCFPHLHVSNIWPQF